MLYYNNTNIAARTRAIASQHKNVLDFFKKLGSHDLIQTSYKLLIAHFLEIAPLISSFNHFIQGQFCKII